MEINLNHFPCSIIANDNEKGQPRATFIQVSMMPQLESIRQDLKH